MSFSCSRSGALFDVRRDKILGLWLNDVPRGEQKGPVLTGPSNKLLYFNTTSRDCQS